MQRFTKNKKERDHSGSKIGFHLVKVNSYGIKQQRTMFVSSEGVSNVKGKKTQWFYPNDKVHSLAVNPKDPSKFQLNLILSYQFEAESPEQVERIISAFDQLKLGQFGNPESNGAIYNYNNEYEQRDSIRLTSPSTLERKGSKKIGIDDFELLRVVGRGSFSKVMLVRKKDTGKLYAMKVLRKDELLKRNQVEHINTEKHVLQTISHPFIVRLHYSFQTHDKLYMCMDFVNGGELFYHLKRYQRFSEEIAAFYIAEIICAIEYLHKHDIIYRDLKPENILLDSDGHIRMTDLGLSKAGITSAGGTAPGSTTSTFCGTPDYLAPEIIQTIGHGKGVDWWSCGILLYEMLTGHTPFKGKSRNDLYQDIVSGELPRIDSVSDAAWDLLNGLLTKRPEDRLGSGEEGAEQIKTHPFFAKIDWNKVASKNMESPFKPVVKDSTDTTNFDPHFTKEIPRDSWVMPSPTNSSYSSSFSASTSAHSPSFQGFTYEDSSPLTRCVSRPFVDNNNNNNNN